MASQLAPKEPLWHYNLGVLYSIQKNYSKAEEKLKTTIRLNPNYSDAYNNLGVVYHAQNEFSEAEKYFIKALEKDPNNKAAEFNLKKSLKKAK